MIVACRAKLGNLRLWYLRRQKIDASKGKASEESVKGSELQAEVTKPWQANACSQVGKRYNLITRKTVQ